MSRKTQASGLLFGEAEPETNATKDAIKSKAPRTAAVPKAAKPNAKQQRQTALYAIERLEQLRTEVVALSDKAKRTLGSGLLVSINKEINKQRDELVRL